MIPSFQEEVKNLKLNHQAKESLSELLLLQKSLKVNVTKFNFDTIRDLHPAQDNTFVCVDFISNNKKKLVHFTLDGKILDELPLKENQYHLFMLSPGYVNFIQYSSDRKPVIHVSQWNLDTHQSITININRQIMPLVKVFAFSQSQTFCVCQYDKHGSQTSKDEQSTSYHTKYKLSYFKYPLRKSNQKPCIVFKTHTNPKQYGQYQEIIKLNDHSMIGSISNKMDQNDQTALKTFDFRNVPMGIQINYKFHVHVNYKKQLLQLWITDMWEMRHQQFYLKCQLRIDRVKEEKWVKQYGRSVELENLEEAFHLTWAYKNQSTIKFAKFKTPFLNSIQFLDSFRQKERSRTLYQRSIIKQKPPIKIQQTFYPLLSSTQPQNHSSQPLIQPISTMSLPSSQSKIQQPLPSTTTMYTKSVHILPIFYINNITEQIIMIDRDFSDWQVSFPAYHSSMVVYFKQSINVNVNGRDGEKILDVIIQKKKQMYTYKEMQVFMLKELVGQCDDELVRKVAGMLDGNNKYREMEAGWYYIEGNKISRQSKSKSNYQSRQYKC